MQNSAQGALKVFQSKFHVRLHFLQVLQILQEILHLRTQILRAKVILQENFLQYILIRQKCFFWQGYLRQRILIQVDFLLVEPKCRLLFLMELEELAFE